jgi:hypothetical protein
MVQSFLKCAKVIGSGSVQFGEKFLGECRADPGAGNGLIGRQLSVEGAGTTSHASADLIGVEQRTGRRQIADRSMFPGKPNFVGMADGTWIMLRLAPQEQHDAIVHVDSSIVVNAVRCIDNAISDEHDWGLDVSRWRIKDREIV